MQTPDDVAKIVVNTLKLFMRKRKLSNLIHDKDDDASKLDLVCGVGLGTFLTDYFEIIGDMELPTTIPEIGGIYLLAETQMDIFTVSVYIDPYMKYADHSFTLVDNEYREMYDFKFEAYLF
jgi:hypothetical protein